MHFADPAAEKNICKEIILPRVKQTQSVDENLRSAASSL
jgi:hypothetical protein